MNPERISSRTPMPAQANGENLRAMLDRKSRRFGWPPIKKGAKGHVCRSERQKDAWILPYPPPLELPGAKTNHLPKMQIDLSSDTPGDGARNKNLDSYFHDSALARSEIVSVSSAGPESAFHRVVSGGYGARRSNQNAKHLKIFDDAHHARA
jgi:hypothetical protein